MDHQPTASYTDADLERVVARDYGAEAVVSVKAVLERYGVEAWQREVLRVRMACLKLAAGDIAELERAVGLACMDYRDVLSPAEYPSYGRARTEDAERKAIESDWKQLQDWLHRP